MKSRLWPEHGRRATFWGALSARFFMISYVFLLGAVAAFGIAFAIVASSKPEVVEALKKAGVGNGEALSALAVGLTVVATGWVLLAAMVRPNFGGGRSFLVRTKSLISEAMVRVSREKTRERDMDGWRNQIIRETYAQVMEQQERGLLCPNCKGRDVGYKESA